MENNQEYLKKLLPLLKKPIPHSWRVQSYSKNKPIATVMAYIDQRDLMDVLDTYCTYGWQKKYEEIAGNLFCSIGINMPDGTTQWRSDCGVESNQDAEKGRASDAAKRAGVNWGIGRFLYDMKVQYVTTNAKKETSNYPHCIDENGKQIWDMTDYINKKNPNAPQAPVLVNEPTMTEKVANMTKAAPKSLTINELEAIQEGLKLVNDIEEFKKYYKSLSKDVQQDAGALELFKYRNEELKKLQLA